CFLGSCSIFLLLVCRFLNFVLLLLGLKIFSLTHILRLFQLFLLPSICTYCFGISRLLGIPFVHLVGVVFLVLSVLVFFLLLFVVPVLFLLGIVGTFLQVKHSRFFLFLPLVS